MGRKRLGNENVGIRYLTVLVIGVLLLAVLSWSLLSGHVLRQMREDSYAVVASLLGKLKEENPEFREEEWVESLGKQEEYRSEGQKLLACYGFLGNNDFSIGQKVYCRQLFLLGGVCVSSACLLIFGGLAYYFYRRQKQIDGLADYIRKVERGEYSLALQENREDELSALRNELYKVTVMLRERADFSIKQKKALSDSVSDISHQLKTPLTSVMVLLDNLSQSGHMDEGTRKRFLAEITRQLTGMNWLVATLLKLSRLDAGVVEFERKQISLDHLLEKVMENLELQAEWKQVQVVREGQTGLQLEGDPGWIGEAVTNLVKNAIEHSHQNSRIILFTEENAVYTSIVVRNWGEIIPKEDQKHLFERFYRSATSGEDSTGIGLSLAKEIIERQNGYLTLSSDQEHGTEFHIKLMKV